MPSLSKKMSEKAPSRVLFVGNIPYELTDDNVFSVMLSMGPVTRFRLVHDQKTLRSKGYCFVEYGSLDDAVAACKEFNVRQIGTRTLRADFTNNFTGVSVIPHPDGLQNNANGIANDENLRLWSQKGGSVTLPNLNVGGNNNNFGGPNNSFGKRGVKRERWQNKDSSYDNQSRPQQNDKFNAGNPRNNGNGANFNQGPILQANDPISQNLNQMYPPQLLEFLKTIPSMVETSPEQVVSIFQSQPSLAYASVQALLLMGFVNENVLSAVASNPNLSTMDIISKVKESQGDFPNADKPNSSGSYNSNTNNENNTMGMGGNEYGSRNNNMNHRQNNKMNKPGPPSADSSSSMSSGNSNRYDPRMKQGALGRSYQGANNNGNYNNINNGGNNGYNNGNNNHNGYNNTGNNNYNNRGNNNNNYSNGGNSHNNYNNGNNNNSFNNGNNNNHNNSGNTGNNNNNNRYQNRNQPQQNNPLNQMTSMGNNDQQAMISQILQLTDEQIQMLPEDQRAMVQMLKSNYAQGN